jgi:hypothetical protein
MMKKILIPLTISVMFLLFATGGCVQPAAKVAGPQAVTEKPALPAEAKKETAKPEKPVTLMLKFKPGDSATYRSITEAEKSIKFEGSTPATTSFKGGKTGNKIDITYTQQIKSVDNKGNAVANITFKQLKYLAKSKDTVTLDFDSSRKEDQNSPLYELIGRTYKIELTPAGQVSRVIDVNLTPVNPKASYAEKVAFTMLFDPNSIKERHAIDTLPSADKKVLHTGDTWSSTRKVSFGLMGSKTYERTYKLKEVRDINNRQTAEVEMSGAAELKADANGQPTSGLSNMFDTTETYAGQFEFDSTNSSVKSYSEKLYSEWTAIQPEEEVKEGKEPIVMIMSAKLSWNIEKID